ncbi:MAG: neutral/alkaline non-lysosomal ceramidase N-terminal domain-containing protein [Pirellulales bacterium]|nr:neutral/alkaline non-lysosomal ceramidase N-terminal domain-containing protein [Pirellulales bacterium]
MSSALRFLSIGLLTLGLASAVAAAPPPVRVGVAEADITPPEGFPMAGYYHERRATGIRDPLKAKAIVFRSDTDQAAFVACDLTGIAADLSASVRRLASEKTGIPAAHIILTATHSHTAPDYSRDLYEYLGAPPEAGQDRYSAKLISGIVDAIVRADKGVQPVALLAGSARQETPISFNRRFVMRDGSVRTWMRLDNPEVVRAAGPIDPEVGLLLVRAADGDRPLGVLTNFALHLDTVGGTLWSGDYPFYVEQSLRQTLGPDVISIFGNGCCGDINHSDPTAKAVNKTDFIGQSLAATVEKGLAKHLARIEQPVLRVRAGRVALPLQEITAADVARSLPLVADAKAGKQVEFFALVTAYKTLILDRLRNREPLAASADLMSWGLSRTCAGVGDSLPVDVQVIAVGRDLAIVCLSGEVFVDLGLAIKRASPFRTTLVVELCNCVETVYVPPRVAYAVGSYEVTNSTVKPGAGELLAETAVRLLREAASDMPPPQ